LAGAIDGGLAILALRALESIDLGERAIEREKRT
jgi:hypothetical protein